MVSLNKSLSLLEIAIPPVVLLSSLRKPAIIVSDKWAILSLHHFFIPSWQFWGLFAWKIHLFCVFVRSGNFHYLSSYYLLPCSVWNLLLDRNPDSCGFLNLNTSGEIQIWKLGWTDIIQAICIPNFIALLKRKFERAALLLMHSNGPRHNIWVTHWKSSSFCEGRMEGLKGCPFSPYWKPLVIISVVSALSSPSSLLPSLLIIFSLLKGNDVFGLLKLKVKVKIMVRFQELHMKLTVGTLWRVKCWFTNFG